MTFEGLDALLGTRAAIRDTLASCEPGSPRRRVVVWVWRRTSKGVPLTRSGEVSGFELRISRYRDEQHA